MVSFFKSSGRAVIFVTGITVIPLLLVFVMLGSDSDLSQFCPECAACPLASTNNLYGTIPDKRVADWSYDHFLSRHDSVADSFILSHNSPFVAPVLDLRATVKVYMWPEQSSTQGHSGRRVIVQGLQDHPNIKLVSSVLDADFVIWHSCGWDQEMIPPSEMQVPNSKLIMVDTSDPVNPTTLTDQRGRLALFKRSWVRKTEEGRRAYAFWEWKDEFMNVYPTGYAIVKEYLPLSKFNGERDIDVICTLRRFDGPTSPREQTIDWMKEYKEQAKNPEKILVGELTSGGREVVDDEYQKMLNRAKIIVTANPQMWEGDSRLYEALASGALVFTDIMYTPLDHPFVHSEHVIFFDIHPFGKKELFKKLDYYLDNARRRNQVAFRGYVHALRHHRAVNRMDSLINTVVQQVENDNVRSRSPYRTRLSNLNT